MNLSADISAIVYDLSIVRSLSNLSKLVCSPIASVYSRDVYEFANRLLPLGLS